MYPRRRLLSASPHSGELQFHAHQQKAPGKQLLSGGLTDAQNCDGLPRTAHGRIALSLLRSHPDEVRLPSVAAEAVHRFLVYPATGENEWRKLVEVFFAFAENIVAGERVGLGEIPQARNGRDLGGQGSLAVGDY